MYYVAQVKVWVDPGKVAPAQVDGVESKKLRSRWLQFQVVPVQEQHMPR